jgi:hypothetical protein
LPKPAPKQVITEETFIEKGRLVQLKKPGKEGGKVVSAIFEILSGQFEKRLVTASYNCMYVHGHHLGISNLVCYFLFI